MTRQFGREFRLDRLQGGVGIGLADGMKGLKRAVEQLTGLLHGNERIVETGSRRILRDRVHLADLFRHAGFDGRLVVGILQLIKGRRLKRQSARRMEGICRTEVGSLDVVDEPAGCQRDAAGGHQGPQMIQAKFHFQKCRKPGVYPN